MSRRRRDKRRCGDHEPHCGGRAGEIPNSQNEVKSAEFSSGLAGAAPADGITVLAIVGEPVSRERELRPAVSRGIARCVQRYRSVPPGLPIKGGQPASSGIPDPSHLRSSYGLVSRTSGT